jgi:2,4-dienoyl-CoA reductase-like NADH-dependent reductase (Old Yellow Enzyme family)
MSSPFETVTFARGPAMANRFMLAPLTNQQSHADGTLSEEEHRFLTLRALGGFGLTMTCAAHVQAVGQGFAGQLAIFGDQHLPGLTRLATDLNAAGTVSYVQLHHAGNRAPAALIGTDPVCPSDDPSTGARALTTGEVEQVVADFVAAARRAQAAGFHGVELHGAHGYLICEFLSAELNRRTDRYGGSPEGRSRLLFEIIDGIRAECGDTLAVAVRLSPERFGVQLDEMIEVFGRLVDGRAVDMIDMSIWDVTKLPVEGGHGGRTLTEIFAELPRGEVRVGAAGKIYDPADVQRVLDQGIDIAVLGRAGILHHDFPHRMAADPGFVPRRAPVGREVLAAEGVSEKFIAYMAASFKGFVAD